MTLASGSIPFWMVFNTEQSAASLEQYVSTRAWKRILLMLFSHGVDSVGVVPIEHWKNLLAKAHDRGIFAGVDERAYPRDFATFIRYDAALEAELQEKTRKRERLSLDSVRRFFSKRSSFNHVKLDILN